MDRMSGKRGAGGIGTSRKGYSSFKDAVTEENQNGQFCNRIGCNGRIKHSQNIKVGSSDKVKYSKPSSGKEIAGKPGGSSSAIGSSKRSNLDSKRKLPSKLKCDSSESSQSSTSESPELVSSPPSVLTRCHSVSLKSGEVPVSETGSSSASSNVRPRKIFHHKSSLHNRTTPPASGVPLASDSSLPGQSNRDSGNRYKLRNLKYNTVSSSTSASCSSPESEPIGMNAAKKRSLVGESSSSRRGNKTNASPNNSPSTSDISISISDSKRSSSFEEGSSSVTSVWTRKSINETNRSRLSSQQNGKKSVRKTRVPDKEAPLNGGGRSFSTSRQNSSSVDEGIGASSLCTRRPVNERSRIRISPQQNGRSSSSVGQLEDNEIPFSFSFGGQSSGRQFPSRTFGVSSNNCNIPPTTMPHDLLYRHRMDEIAEVLLALERIEQDEELTHEQVLALETSLLLSSLNLYDQHRDMRLDIDNMSYEELLALEERMGTVSTALSEEALSNCLERSTYPPSPSKSQTPETVKNGDNTKCSICQEEYEVGNEVGKLIECQHFYHVTCIYQWLRLKNWCPICKASAAASSHTS